MPGRFYGVIGQVLSIAAVYVMGRYNISIAWLMPVMLSSLYNKINRCLRNQLHRSSDEASSVVDLCQIPAWMMFPDVERADWLNTIIKMFWSNVKKIVETALMKKVEPMLQKISVLSTFKFTKVDFGSIVSFLRSYLKILKNVFVDTSNNWHQSIRFKNYSRSNHHRREYLVVQRR